MQAPEPADTVAGIVHQRCAQVCNNDGREQLDAERPLPGPYPLPWHHPRDELQPHKPTEAGQLVHKAVGCVLAGIAVRCVPTGLVGQDAFHQQCGRDREYQQQRHLPQAHALRGPHDGAAVDPDEHERDICVAGKEPKQRHRCSNSSDPAAELLENRTGSAVTPVTNCGILQRRTQDRLRLGGCPTSKRRTFRHL